MEDAAEADAVLEDPVDLKDGVVCLLGFAVGHVVNVQYHLLHPPSHSSLSLPPL